MRIAFVVVSLALAVSAATSMAASQEPVDTAMARRIIDEATKHSRVMEHAFYLTDVFGPRLTGTSTFKGAGQWATTQLRHMGLQNVHTEPVLWGRSWVERSFGVQLVAPVRANLTAVAVPWSLPTASPLEAEPVLAPLPGCSADSAAYDAFFKTHKGQLRGRIVLGAEPLPRDPEPGGRSYGGRPSDEWLRRDLAETERRAAMESTAGQAESMEPYRAQHRYYEALNMFLQREGVAAVLYPSPSYGGEVRLMGDLPCRTQYAGGRDPQFPLPPASAVLSWEHYNRIVRLLRAQQPVRLRIALAAELPEDPTAAFNVVGEIPGTTKADELVLIGAHLDSWSAGTGATDNAAGSAVMIEAMRILKALDVRPYRTIRIALWAGEEGAGLGSRSYVRDHLSRSLQLDWMADPVAISPLPEHSRLSGYFNLDQTGYRIRGLYLEGIEALRPIFASWFRPFRQFGEYHLVNATTGGSDQDSFNLVGVPGFFFIQDGSPYSVWTAHSNNDLYDHLVPEDLQQSAAIIAFFAYQTAMRDALLPRARQHENGTLAQVARRSLATCDRIDQCLTDFTCRGRTNVLTLPASASFAPNHDVTSDGKGSYVEGREFANVSVRSALNIHPTIPGAESSRAVRSLRIDLSRPVDSTAVSLGVVEDKFADFHAWGPTLAANGILSNVQDLAVGDTIKSAAVHIDFHYKGRYYLLQVGPEPVGGGGCSTGGTGVFGTGTTQATVSRPDRTRFVVEAPEGSIGRLFDITNKLPGAVNKGLYYTSFKVEFSVQWVSFCLTRACNCRGPKRFGRHRLCLI